nr:MAG TPA: Protein of unknown function (DUF3985) [Caudoviricetes sp.]
MIDFYLFFKLARVGLYILAVIIINVLIVIKGKKEK